MKTIHYQSKKRSHLVTIAPMAPFTPKSTSKLRSALHFRYSIVIRTQNSELIILFNIIHEDCNKFVIVTIIQITVINGKNYETKYIILFNKKKL